MICQKCAKMCGVLVFVAGLLLLSRDLGIWEFWNLSPWTLVFLLVGLAKLGSSGCKDCKKMCK